MGIYFSSELFSCFILLLGTRVVVMSFHYRAQRGEAMRRMKKEKTEKMRLRP
jgi:hypothetical protein